MLGVLGHKVLQQRLPEGALEDAQAAMQAPAARARGRGRDCTASSTDDVEEGEAERVLCELPGRKRGGALLELHNHKVLLRGVSEGALEDTQASVQAAFKSRDCC